MLRNSLNLDSSNSKSEGNDSASGINNNSPDVSKLNDDATTEKAAADINNYQNNSNERGTQNIMAP